METQLQPKKRVRKYSSRNALRREMLTLNPVFPDFVSGSSTGAGTHFYCKVGHRDVKMVTRGSGKFSRHFRSDGHWFKDVTYRVHMSLPIYNRLLEPMTLTEAQRVEYASRPFVELPEGFPFPEAPNMLVWSHAFPLVLLCRVWAICCGVLAISVFYDVYGVISVRRWMNAIQCTMSSGVGLRLL